VLHTNRCSSENYRRYRLGMCKSDQDWNWFSKKITAIYIITTNSLKSVVLVWFRVYGLVLQVYHLGFDLFYFFTFFNLT
jgi:hypothetical protein